MSYTDNMKLTKSAVTLLQFKNFKLYTLIITLKNCVQNVSQVYKKCGDENK